MGGLLKDGENKARGRAFDKLRTLNLKVFLLGKVLVGECLAGSPTHSLGGEENNFPHSLACGVIGGRREMIRMMMSGSRGWRFWRLARTGESSLLRFGAKKLFPPWGAQPLKREGVGIDRAAGSLLPPPPPMMCVTGIDKGGQYTYLFSLPNRRCASHAIKSDSSQKKEKKSTFFRACCVGDRSLSL